MSPKQRCLLCCHHRKQCHPEAGPSGRGSFPHGSWLWTRDRGSSWSHRSYLSVSALYITPVGCDGKMASPQYHVVHFCILAEVYKAKGLFLYSQRAHAASEQEHVCTPAPRLVKRAGIERMRPGRTKFFEVFPKLSNVLTQITELQWLRSRIQDSVPETLSQSLKQIYNLKTLLFFKKLNFYNFFY